jgi:uncharacterized protein with HEPN domain
LPTPKILRRSAPRSFQKGSEILGYAKDTTREKLPSVSMRLDAVLYEIVVLGEAARRLSPEIRAAHPEVPWREIIGMRSIITHGYDQIDDDELWQVIEHDLPDLIPKLENVLSQTP